MASNDPNRPEKVYPGNLSAFEELRTTTAGLDPEKEQLVATMIVATQLAGIAYILDGIRYSLRDKN